MKDIGKSIKLKIVRSVKESDFIALYREAGWFDETCDKQMINRVLKGSFCFAAAFDDDRMIGMGRGISDGCSDGYIQDLVVLKQYRKHGIGSGIVRIIVKHFLEKGIDWIGLIAEPGSGNFYRELGFRKMKKHIPMKLDLKKF